MIIINADVVVAYFASDMSYLNFGRLDLELIVGPLVLKQATLFCNFKEADRKKRQMCHFVFCSLSLLVF